MPGPIKAKYVEKEHAVVDGVDVSGHWNRMFEQRTIFEYTPELIEKVASIPGAESFADCYQCAKCIAVCPVDVVGNYGPRKLYRYAQTGIDLTEAPELWLCTTCANCLRVCPKEVNMVKIMPATREQAILDGKFVPPELQQAFENTAKSGNPLGQPQRKRDAWIQSAGVPVPIIKDLARPVDVLWYVGSYPSYHPRGIDAASAAARIFTALGIDFAILGKEEKDDADSQRLQNFLEAGGDLVCQPFLDLQAPGERVDDPRDLRKADDPALWQVGDVGPAEKREQVVLAEAEKIDVAYEDHFVAIGRKHGPVDDDIEVLLIASSQPTHGLFDAVRSPAQPRPIRVLPEPHQHFSDKLTDLGPGDGG